MLPVNLLPTTLAHVSQGSPFSYLDSTTHRRMTLCTLYGVPVVFNASEFMAFTLAETFKSNS